MSRTQPRLSQVPLWDRHVDLVLTVIRDALGLLAARKFVGNEVELNRALYECVLQANRDRFDAGLAALDVAIMWESRNQPTPSTATGTAERKIPDFQCGYVDHLCKDPLLSAKAFVIECKRLGQPTPSGWDFNAHYVADGVVRFVDAGWQYGKHVGSGAMVGYLDGTRMKDVLVEVNVAATSQSLPKLTYQARPSAPLHELKHTLTRSFPESPFELTHLWIENPAPVKAARRRSSAKRKTAKTRN